MIKVLVINGPNLNLLGKRDPEMYGTETLESLNGKLSELAEHLNVKLAFYQSNSEGDLIDFLHKEGPNVQGIIINPGALSHYSHALRDAIEAIDVETVEVHLSNIYAREEFRRQSVIAPVCAGHLAGFGFYGYAMALSYFTDYRQEKQV